MLIYCTNCGKPISDQAKVCPHCNFVFADVVEKQSRQTVDYMTLPQDKKDGLLEEFSKDYPMHGMNISSQLGGAKKNKVLSTIMVLFCFLVMVLCFLMISNIENFEKDEPPIALLGIVITLTIGMIVMFIIVLIFRKKGGGNYESLKSHKYFEEWLKKRGYDNYQVNLTSENKKYMYKNIEIDEEIK